MLSKWEVIFLIIMTIPIMGHVLILPLMIDVVGRDVWISILLAAPIGFLLLLVIFRLKLTYQDLSAREMFRELLGKWGGRVLFATFAIYFLFLTILTIGTLIDVVLIAFYQETPIYALILWFMAFALYAAMKGIKRIALTAGILTLIGMLTGTSITMMTTPLKDWGELLPILEFGLAPVFIGTLILVNIWVELLFILFVPVKDLKERGTLTLWIVAALINIITMLSTSTGVITIYGLQQADNFTFPAQEIVRIINLGIIDRFDIYGMILMTFGSYIRFGLYFRIVYEQFVTQKTSQWLRVLTFIGLAIVVFFASQWLVSDVFRLGTAINVYAYTFVLFPVPFILLIIAWIKKKRGTKKSGKSNKRGKSGKSSKTGKSSEKKFENEGF